jgi:hypothetical protein
MAKEPSMKGDYTCNVTSDTPEPSIEEKLRLITKMPRMIGSLYGYPVHVDPTLEPGTVEIRGGANGTVRFSVDHPYVQGTAIAEAARKALGHK